jgi:trimethylamine--corrinoid protein Co-methyltransferase
MFSDSKSLPYLKFNVLSPRQMRKIHLASLRILEDTGLIVENDEALELLNLAGAQIKDSRVKIPACLVGEALKSAPTKITLANRNGYPAFTLEGNRVFFGANTDCLNIIDPFTRKRRPSLREDSVHAALICDHLSNIDWISIGGLYNDVPQEIRDSIAFKKIAVNTTKPILFGPNNLQGLNDVIEMATTVARGPDNLKRYPFIIGCAGPISPLFLDFFSTSVLLKCVEKEIPIVYAPMPMMGATAPAVLAGTLAVACAECLGGLVVAELKKKGAPFVFGGLTTLMDMSTTVCSYGAPESHLLCAGLTDMAHFYGLPMYGTAGCSDSKILDEQAAIESTLSSIMSVFSGANLVHDIGLIESGTTLSLEMIVMTDEIIGMVKQIMRGIRVNKETLPLDLVNKVGPGGNFLAEEHTLKHFKEWWFPTLLDRQKHNSWHQAGELSLRDRLNDKVKRIIQKYHHLNYQGK